MEKWVNGDFLGIETDWDNDLCRKIVDQKYRVSVEYRLRGEEGLHESLRQKVEALENSGFADIYASAKLGARKVIASSEDCLKFFDSVKDFGAEIFERKFTAYGGEYWTPITREEIEQVVKGERQPTCRLDVQYNPNFSPSVDIGESW